MERTSGMNEKSDNSQGECRAMSRARARARTANDYSDKKSFPVPSAAARTLDKVVKTCNLLNPEGVI